MDVGVVGAGRVGTAMAVLLRRAGHRVVAASGGDRSRERVERFLPGVPFRPAAEAASAAPVVMLAVPDDAIAPTCGDLAGAGAFRRGGTVVHLSGSVSLSALDPARSGGTEVASVHPLQSLPDVEEAVARLPGSAVAVTAWTEEGYHVGEQLAGAVGGRAFRLEDRWKPLYHAAAVFCSNYLTVTVGVAERLFRRAGVSDPSLFAPLARASVDGALRGGAGSALTGPAVRGDAGTVHRNLQALAEHDREAIAQYVTLARAALALAEEAGRLEPEARSAVEEELASWS